VRQQSTCVEFLCPRVLLYQDSQGAYRTGDLSNLTLDVRPGTELAVIAESGERLYCKKDGVEGWYCGPYAPIST
jgi:hypothetical protein